MKKIFSVVAVLALCVYASSAQDRLVILHTNDTHSHIDPERGSRDAGRGGVIERAAFIDSVRAVDGKKNVLLLDAGDFDQGSSYFTILNGDLEVNLLNAMGYDAVAIGNHEFDNGLDELARRCKAIKADVLCANYDFSSFKLGKYVKPYAIYKRGGKKIGVIGLLCDVRSVVSTETAALLTFLSPSECVNKWSSYLREKKHCDMVIVLSHLGYGSPVPVEGDLSALAAPAITSACNIMQPAVRPEEAGRVAADGARAAADGARVAADGARAANLHDGDDCNMAALSHGVDIVVGGHSHTNLPVPTVIYDLDGKPVTIVQDYRWGLFVGQFDVR